MEDRLQDARKMIDEIDDRMAELFVSRMEAVREVARYKKEHGLGITDSSREKENLSKAAARVQDDALRGYYSRFLLSTMDLAKDYQRTLLQGMRVAYAGIPGAYAHAAAVRVFPGCETVPCANFAQAYVMVVKGGSDACVLPLENSAAGVVGQVNDLIFSGPLYICGSVELPVRHVLCAAEGTREEDIRTVVSHPQALQQCAAYIESRHLAVMEYENTAMADRKSTRLNSSHAT